MKVIAKNRNRLCMNFSREDRSVTGFTLIELVLTIIIIGIIFTASARIMWQNIDTHKFKATMKEMDQIVLALKTYIAENSGLPAAGTTNIQFLSSYFSATVPYDRDGWGRLYDYNDAGAVITISSFGADGVAGGGASPSLDDDIMITFQQAIYDDNRIFVNVFDKRGVILRGDDSATIDNLYHISAMRLVSESDPTVPIYAVNNLYLSTEFQFTAIPIGRYHVVVTIADGTGTSTIDWRQHLLPEGGSTFTTGTFTVLPKGTVRFQPVPVRLPGAIDTSLIERLQ